MEARNRRLIGRVALAALVAVLAWAPSASATIWTLTDLNSVVRVNDSSQAGAFNWFVDGQSQLYQQWFWFRIGDSAEASIDTLALISAQQFSPSLLQLVYGGPGFELTLNYSLLGGSNGSGRSDLDEQIRIRNTGGVALDFHFFQFSDFDLCGAGGDTVIIDSPNRVRQFDGGCSLAETVEAPGASRWEANGFPATLLSLNDGLATNLNNNQLFGPGDATWAYQWDRQIGVNDSFLISKNKTIQPVPEPMTVTLLGAGLAGLALRRRKR